LLRAAAAEEDDDVTIADEEDEGDDDGDGASSESTSSMRHSMAGEREGLYNTSCWCSGAASEESAIGLPLLPWAWLYA
jgi:hypothetical protein